jgi:RalA-binding protein 1
MSSFLIEIVTNSNMNKMTVRNVGIVFAPTLNIPAPLISFFLTDFGDIFGAPVDEASSPINEMHASTSQLGDEIRSPRRQMFSDIPTPSYSDTSFPQSMAPPQQQRHERPPSSFPMMGGGAPSSFPMAGAAPNYPPPAPPQQQQAQYSGYESGFIPLRPSYEAPAYEQHYQSSEGYGSLNGAPPQGNARTERQRKRESGMLLMSMGNSRKNHSNGPSRRGDGDRGNPMLIREESAFD